MQIELNTTGMVAGLTVATDKSGVDHCVAVVKGTFVVGADGQTTLADVQAPLVTADEHYGAPDKTSIRYESEFALAKPCTDVTFVGAAVAPHGRAVKELIVVLDLPTGRKQLRVVGDRRWERGLAGLRLSEPAPFRTIPLVYERAFGGSDHSHRDAKHHGTELRNPLGVGFHRNPDTAVIVGSPLPNIEDPHAPITSPRSLPPPVGCGVVGRSWQPRIKQAGTYDADWLKDRAPFLPADFDDHYFLSAPVDQQLPHLRGGEVLKCLHMSPEGPFMVTVPRVDVPVSFRFHDRDVLIVPVLDTVIVEPGHRRIMVVWRASTRLRKLNALREVHVGPRKRAA